MATYSFANNAKTTLSGSINNTSDPVTFSVQAGEGALLPAAGGGVQFFLVVQDDPDPDLATAIEIMLCTNRSGDSLTCTRAQQGTIKQAFLNGHFVSAPVTKSDAERWEDKPTNTAFNLQVRETKPQWADCDVAIIQDPDGTLGADGAVKWIGRVSTTHADSYVDNTNNDPAVVASNAFGSGDKVVRLVTDMAIKSTIVVPQRSVLVAGWGPSWAGGTSHEVSCHAGFSSSDNMLEMTGNGGILRGVILQGGGDCAWCIATTATDLFLDSVSTYDGILGGVTTSGARTFHHSPHYRQPGDTGYCLYVTGGADGRINGDAVLSGSGPNADEACLRVNGDGFSMTGGHLNGSAAAPSKQVALIEKDVRFANIEKFDTCTSGPIVRIEGGAPTFLGCTFYTASQPVTDNLYPVIEHNSASIITVQGCSSTIAGSPSNFWSRFIKSNGSNTKQIVIGNRMGSIKTGVTPWNNEPMIHGGNTLNGAVYDMFELLDHYDFVYAGLLPTSWTGEICVPIYRGGTIVKVEARCYDAPTGQSIKLDFNKNIQDSGATLYTTQANRPEIAASTRYVNATLPDVLTVAAADYLTMDGDQSGSANPGRSVTGTIWVRPS